MPCFYFIQKYTWGITMFTHITNTEIFIAGKPLIYCVSALLICTVHRKYDILGELVLITNDSVDDCSFDLLSSQVFRYRHSAEMVNLFLASGPVTPKWKNLWRLWQDGTTQTVQITRHMQGVQSRETSVPAHHMAWALENLLVAPRGSIHSTQLFEHPQSFGLGLWSRKSVWLCIWTIQIASVTGWNSVLPGSIFVAFSPRLFQTSRPCCW